MEQGLQNYEHLIKYNGSDEHYINTGQQILIVRENEHLINVNKPIQFVVQEENTKEFENVSCPKSDASQQPVYYQLNNSSELIPIAVNSRQVGEPSFQNIFLLPNATDEAIEPENVVCNKDNEIHFTPNLEDESVNMDVDENKLSGGYAEITLNDEQYKFYEQNGWILLEINEKLFILNSSGLREITEDDEFFDKLKLENTDIVNINQLSRYPMNVTMVPAKQDANANNTPEQEVSHETGPMEVVTGIETVYQEEISHQVTQDSMVMPITHIPTQPKVQETDLCDNRKIRIQTQYQLKDIPKEIVLGKTINGKNLIARVIEGKGSIKNTTNLNKDVKAEVGRDRNINEKQFAKLIQQVLLGTAENCRMEDIASVETVIMQVFQVPNLRPDLHKHKLIVTKTVREENEKGLIQNQSEPAVVTGRFIMKGTEGGFVHIPDMLQTLMRNAESEDVDEDIKKEGTVIADSNIFLHVNITESKDINNISRVSVMVNKRYLSLSHVYNMKDKHINAVFACTGCAKLFKEQEELKDHQQHQCTLAVSEEQGDNPELYTVIKARNKIKMYMCKECKANFVKFDECQEHLRTHYKDSTSGEKSQESSDSKENNVFKCRMCDITYLHSSSLTKHILAKHIMIKY